MAVARTTQRLEPGAAFEIVFLENGGSYEKTSSHTFDLFLDEESRACIKADVTCFCVEEISWQRFRRAHNAPVSLSAVRFVCSSAEMHSPHPPRTNCRHSVPPAPAVRCYFSDVISRLGFSFLNRSLLLEKDVEGGRGRG